MKLQFLTFCLLLSCYFAGMAASDQATLLKYQKQLNNSLLSSKKAKINIIVAILQDDMFCDDFDSQGNNIGSYTRSCEIHQSLRTSYCCCKFYIKDQVVQDHMAELKKFVDDRLSNSQKN